MSRILHLLDDTSPPDALSIMAQIVDGQRIAALGHRSTGAVAAEAGIPAGAITWLPSVGWADPSGRRALRRLIAEWQPTHLHAWGLPAAFATAFFPGPRLMTLVEPPAPRHHILIRLIPSCHWITTSGVLRQHLVRLGVTADRLREIRPGIALTEPPADRAALREALGLAPDDGPVLLLAGEGGATPGSAGPARHDYGLWAAAILQQFFPRIRVIVRGDARGRPDHGLNRLLNDLPDNEVTIDAATDYCWTDLLSIADLLVVCADQMVATGGILRAMASGVPVVATPVESLRELIEDGRNGLLTKQIHPRAIAARVEEFFADAALRQKLAAEARKDLAAHFSPQSMLSKYKELYESPQPVNG